MSTPPVKVTLKNFPEDITSVPYIGHVESPERLEQSVANTINKLLSDEYRVASSSYNPVIRTVDIILTKNLPANHINISLTISKEGVVGQ